MTVRPGFVLGWLAVVAACVTPVLLHPEFFFQDDSYFYLQIAWNVAAGHGSTFHEVTPTNGYHPLWMLPCVAAQALAGGDRGAALYLTMLMQIALYVAIAVAWLRVCDRLRIVAPAPGLALLTAYFLCIGLYGSEAHLGGALLLVTVLALLRADDATRVAPWFAAGAVGGLAVLARLDALFVVAALTLAFAARGRLRAPSALAARAAAAGTASAAVLAPYLLYNASTFGHLMPISGAIKSTFPHPGFDPGRLGTLGTATAMIALVALVLAALVRRDARLRTALCGFGAGVLLHAAYVVTFTDHYTYWHWYYVAGVLCAALVLSAGLDTLTRRASGAVTAAAVRTAGLVLAAGLVFGGAGYAWLKAFAPPALGPVPVPQLRTYRWADELAVWMKENMPPESVVFAYDYPGTIAYRSGLRIVPADGLVNDFAYDDALREEGVTRYLCNRGVTHYFGADVPDGGSWGPRGQIVVEPARRDAHTLSMTTPLTRSDAGRMTLPNAARVVRVPQVVSRPGDAPPLAIWSLGTVCGEPASGVPSVGPGRGPR